MRWFASAVLLASLAACGSQVDPRLAPLAHAPIVVGEEGVALGDLVLGRTTLGEVHDRFGAERVSWVVADQMGIELEYADGELGLLFLYETNPRDDDEVDAWRSAPRDLATFLAGNEFRRGMLLASITVVADGKRESTFHQGALACGVKLLDPLLESVARMGVLPSRERPPMLAGMSPNLPREKACFPDLGLVLYGEAEPDPETPSRVTRITLFLPREP